MFLNSNEPPCSYTFILSAKFASITLHTGSAVYMQIMHMRVVQMEHSGHEQVTRHQTLPADCSSTTLTDLEPGVSYKIIVEAVTSVRTSLDETRRTTTVMSKPIIARTRAPCEAPRTILTGYTSTTVRLHWQRPLLEARHSERHVRLSLEGYRLDINGQPHMRLSAATHECTLVKCRPGKTYSLSLVALTCTENAKKARAKKVD